MTDDIAKLVAKFKEPTLILTMPQSEVLAVASAVASYCVAHEGNKKAAQIIALLQQFQSRVMVLPGLTVEARRYLDSLEDGATSKGDENHEGNEEDTTWKTHQ